jgi:hypothetical protein
MSSQSAISEPAVVAEKSELIAAVELLAVSNLYAAFFVTSSSITVHNDTINSIAVSFHDSNAMNDNFPNGNIAADQLSTHTAIAT